ncbi:MAG: single-stranded-DNA-specific exonuclease RecJ [Janthinobacterium lividum]
MNDISPNFLPDKNLSLSQRLWQMTACDDRLALTFSQRHDIPLILGKILSCRGLTLDNVDLFLKPSLKTALPNPSDFKDLDLGVDRVVLALKNKEKVAIFGDYDVDGATSSAILYQYLSKIGLDVTVYIPDRIQEGYGPNISALEKLSRQGIKLVITVDCGMTAFDALAAAQDMGLEVIVIDHHMPETAFPKALAVINPNRLDEEGGFGYLAAVGVCFIFLVGLNRTLREQNFFKQGNAPDLLSLLDLVALGTVCDVVPLKGLNRAFVTQGLKIAASRQNLGLKTLMDISAVHEKVSTYHLGFMLGPRINAGGRVGEANLGIRLLTTTRSTEAQEISQRLDSFNRERQEIEQYVLQEATVQAEGQVGPLLVLHGLNWHAGVIGIVAGRLKERFNRPILIISIDEQGIGKGSGRSISTIDLGVLIHAAKNKGILVAGGGHAMAAGFSIESSKINDLRLFLQERILHSQADLTPCLKIDGTLSLKGTTSDFVKTLEKLAPYGQGNPTPRFVFENVRVVKPALVGQDHVRCLLTSDDGGRVSAISFRCLNTPLGDALLNSKGEQIHVVGTLKLDSWMDQERVQLTIEDAIFSRPMLRSAMGS